MPDTLDESREKHLGIIARIIVDLTTEKAVFRGNIALYVGEAQYPPRKLMSQQQSRQPPHRVTDQMEAFDIEMLQHLQCHLHQQRDGYPGQVTAEGFTAAGCVEGNKGVTVEFRLQRDPGIVLFGRTKTMQKNDRRQLATPVNGGDVQLHTVNR